MNAWILKIFIILDLIKPDVKRDVKVKNWKENKKGYVSLDFLCKKINKKVINDRFIVDFMFYTK